MAKLNKVEPHWLAGTAFKLSIQCNNAAFGAGEDYKPHAANVMRDGITRILRQVADDINNTGSDLGMYHTIYDINGNNVGRYALKDVAANGDETFPQILRRAT